MNYEIELVKEIEGIPEDWDTWASEHYGTSEADMKWWKTWWKMGGCLFIKREASTPDGLRGQITGSAIWGETPGDFWKYEPKKATEYDTRTVILGVEGNITIDDMVKFTGTSNMLVLTDKQFPDYNDRYAFAVPAFWGRHCKSEGLTCKKCMDRTLATTGRAVSVCGCVMRGYIFD